MSNNTSALIKVAARAFRPPRPAVRPIRPAAVNRNIVAMQRPNGRSNGGVTTPTATPRQQYLPGFDPRHSMRGPYPSKLTPNAGAHYEAQMRDNGFVRDMQGNWVHRNSYDPTTPAGTPTSQSITTADMPTRPLPPADIPTSVSIRPIALDTPAALRPGSVPNANPMQRLRNSLESAKNAAPMRRLNTNRVISTLGGGVVGAGLSAGLGTWLGYGYLNGADNGQNQPAAQPQPVTTIPQPAQPIYPSVTGPTPRSLTLPYMN